jgi:hypothetical protein
VLPYLSWRYQGAGDNLIVGFDMRSALLKSLASAI